MKRTGASALLSLLSISVCCGDRLQTTYFSSHIAKPSDCKLSHQGTEYTGNRSVTFVGEPCRLWADPNLSDHEDKDFPEGSRHAARNYCRNPSNREKGPWCYRVGKGKPSESDIESCAVPLCSQQKCRLTGLGAEFSGEVDRSTSGAKCLKWTSVMKHKKKTSDVERFPDEAFPEKSRKWARNYCRNPDGDKNGPWCYVRDETSSGIHREYCDDIPLCVPFGKFVTSNRHDTFLQLQEGTKEISLSMRLWDPRDWKQPDIRITVSSVASISSDIELFDAGLGFEIRLGAFHASLTRTQELVETYKLSAMRPANVSIRWSSHYLRIHRDGMPLFGTPFKERAPLKYLVVSGRNVMWDISGQDRGMSILTIGGERASQMRPLMPSPTGRLVQVWVRSRGGACLDLTETPSVGLPRLRVCFDDNNSTNVYFHKEEKEPATIVRQEKSLGLTTWWKWRQLSVSVDASGLLVVTMGDNAVPLLRFKAALVRRQRWFGFSSERKSVAHWSLDSRPADDSHTSRPVLPECIQSKAGLEYSGTQWTTLTGKVCRLWALVRNPFVNGSSSAALHYCRNPTGDPQGPYCFVSPNEKEPCDVRLCKSPDCRRSGIATDYAGHLAVTRSNRTCRLWVDAAIVSLRNDSLFPERSIALAKNFCRDPSRSLSGPWCYTDDSDVPTDLCHVPDCDKNDDCVVLTHGMRDSRDMFILPTWKLADGPGLRFALKQWDPAYSDGITFELRPLRGSAYERLTIGDFGHPTITFERVDSSGKTTFHQQIDLPYPILIGEWTSFWLRFLQHQLQLGVSFSAVPIATFPLTGDAMLVDYYSAHGHAVGTSFSCRECHVERTNTPRMGRMLPLSFRGVPPPLRLWLRGSGVATVAFVKLPREEPTTAFSIGINSTIIRFVRDDTPYSAVLAGVKAPFPLILNDTWTEFNFRLEEHLVRVERSGQVILAYRPPKPYLVYFFAVAASEGSIMWTANCLPPEIGEQRDGDWSNWSPWTCPVTCGGGRGFRRRSCTSPPPSLTGRVCQGFSVESGPCNNFPCTALSPMTLRKLRTHLQLRTVALSAQLGEAMNFSCGEPDALDALRREVPTFASSMAWTRNGLALEPVDSRVKVDADQVEILSAMLSDSGVYVCQIRQGDQLLALRVVVLSVTSLKPTIVLRATVSKLLKCGALELGLFFSGLHVHWLHDGVLAREDRPVEGNQDDFLLLSGHKEMDGIWECIVFSADLNVSWRTSWHKVHILSAPSFSSHLLEDRATKWLFGWAASEHMAGIFLALLIGGVFGLVCLGVLIFLGFYFYMYHNGRRDRPHKKLRR